MPRPRYRLHEGFRMPMGFPVDGLRSALRYQPSADDLIVATYPKCGTTWVQHIVYLLLNRGKPLPSTGRMTEVFPHLEEVGAQFAADLPAPRLIKTHLPFSMTPWSSQARYVCVARNPFDCVVSFYHHTRGFVRHYDFADGRFDDFFECFISGEVDFGDYFDHLVPWCAQQRRDNVLFLTYETMLKNPAAAVSEIGKFIGGDAATVVCDPALAARVLEHSSFDAMRRDQQRWSSERPADMPAFVRKGVAGDWRHHLTSDQARRLADRFTQRTAGTEAAALWPDVLATARSWNDRRNSDD